MDKYELKESVLLNLRSVTQSCKGGVPLYRLERDYKDLLGTPIPYRELGFNSLEAFIQDIPDVISLKRNREGQFMAEGVADASTAHIASLVSRQRQAKPSGRGSRKSYFSRGRGGSSSRFRSRGGRSSYMTSSNVPLQPSGKSYKQDKVSYDNHSRNHVQPSKSPLLPPPKVNSASSRPDRPVRKNEIAPRFLRLNQKRVEETFSGYTYSPPKTPPERNSPIPRIPSPIPRISSPRAPSFEDEAYDLYNGNRIQKTPRPLLSRNNFGRLDRYKEQLENARTNKEYVEIYAKANGFTVRYKTSLCGQKKKSFVSNLELGKNTYRSYPEVARTEEDAEEIAAQAAVEDIKNNADTLASLPETPISNAGEIQTFLSRIEELVYSKPTGMFINGIVREYENKFNESLPDGWIDVLKQSSVVIMEEVAVKFGKVPDGTNFIVKVNRHSSGSTTPSEASIRLNAEQDLDNGDFSSKDDFEDFYQTPVPDLIIPDGNEWAVYITNTSGALAGRLIDHDAEFYSMSKAMSAFYDAQTLPVQVVYERHLYAAACERVNGELLMNRVLANRILDNDNVECYFVDEGMFGEIQKSDLQELHEDFLMVPYQAVYFSLEGLDDLDPFIQPEHIESLLYKTYIAVVKRSCSSIEEFLPDDPGVHHIVYSVLLYDTSDNENDICVNDFVKELVTQSLACKFPKPGVSSRGYLTHVTETGEIYLRFLHPQNSWLELELEKHSKAFEKSCQRDIRLEAGKIYAAKYADGKWYRATLSSNSIVTDPQMVWVIFIDYGHPSLVKKIGVCELEPHSEFLSSLGPQAISCELHNALPSPNTKWSKSASVKLMELAPFNEELIVRVISEGDSKSLPKVSLHKRIYNKEDSFIISINETLASRLDASATENMTPAKVPTQLNLHHSTGSHASKGSSMSDFVPRVATPVEESLINAIRKTTISTPTNDGIEWLMTPDNIKSPDAFEDKTPLPLNPPEVPKKKEIFDVYVTMAATPHLFVVQPLKSAPQMTALMNQMNQFYSIEENLIEMHPTLLKEYGYYAALHPQDSAWYRVQLLSVSPSEPYMAAVYYVDFGDINTVTMQNVQKLWNQFRNLPCQAIKASLAGVMPKEMDWRAEHCIQFKEMVTERMFVAIVQNRELRDESESSAKVELTLIDTSVPDKDIYIHELLIEKEMARPALIE